MSFVWVIKKLNRLVEVNESFGNWGPAVPFLFFMPVHTHVPVLPAPQIVCQWENLSVSPLSFPFTPSENAARNLDG